MWDGIAWVGASRWVWGADRAVLDASVRPLAGCACQQIRAEGPWCAAIVCVVLHCTAVRAGNRACARALPRLTLGPAPAPCPAKPQQLCSAGAFDTHPASCTEQWEQLLTVPYAHIEFLWPLQARLVVAQKGSNMAGLARSKGGSSS
jgi:hypothetical protein